MAPFAALDDEAGPAAWGDLAELLGPDHRAVVVAPSAEPPAGWSIGDGFRCVQMVATRRTPSTSQQFVSLGPTDVADMLELVAATQPGPFRPRTVELGGYIGVREGGRLVAMAGERMRCPGYTEVSGVCTAASHRGKGLATALTLSVVDQIRARGEEAFLHALVTNETAIRLYEELGFETRCEVDLVPVTPPA